MTQTTIELQIYNAEAIRKSLVTLEDYLQKDIAEAQRMRRMTVEEKLTLLGALNERLVMLQGLLYALGGALTVAGDPDFAEVEARADEVDPEG